MSAVLHETSHGGRTTAETGGEAVVLNTVPAALADWFCVHLALVGPRAGDSITASLSNSTFCVCLCVLNPIHPIAPVWAWRIPTSL